jgi:hypothetical protein
MLLGYDIIFTRASQLLFEVIFHHCDGPEATLVACD